MQKKVGGRRRRDEDEEEDEEEEEEEEGESLTPVRRRTPLAIHQSRPALFLRRNNHRADSQRSLRSSYVIVMGYEAETVFGVHYTLAGCLLLRRSRASRKSASRKACFVFRPARRSAPGNRSLIEERGMQARTRTRTLRSHVGRRVSRRQAGCSCLRRIREPFYVYNISRTGEKRISLPRRILRSADRRESAGDRLLDEFPQEIIQL